MTGFALTLLLAAGFIHASWNYLAKRTGGGLAFVWIFAVCSALMYAPLAVGLVIWQQPAIGWAELGMMAGTVVIHIAYFLLLQHGYRVGDLSLVYPLARGSGPLLSMALAVVLLGERPSALAAGGGLMVAAGILAMAAGAGVPGSAKRPGVVFGLLTGVTIALYTLWDKLAVSRFLIPPLLLVNANDIGRALILGPAAVRQWRAVRREWRAHRGKIVAAAALCPLSYILVLTALVTTPVSTIAPAREVSILFGTLMGTRWLAEGESRRRLAAAAAIAAGVAALAFG
jgi:drug/metabolite transporter (DMT)-like permease